jgi:hypothetical protein
MTYTFKNRKTGRIIEVQLKISEYDQYKKDHPELERYIDVAPAVSWEGKVFTSSSLDRGTDDTFKEVLAKIGDKHPGSPLHDNYTKSKSGKRVKTKEIFDKHVKKIKKEGKL